MSAAKEENTGPDPNCKRKGCTNVKGCVKAPEVAPVPAGTLPPPKPHNYNHAQGCHKKCGNR
jgi:hypothetical protein